MAGKKGQKKRVWSDEEKRSICMQVRVSDVSVAQVARRYAMNTNLIHKWLRDPRFAPEDQAADLAVPAGATFLPVEVAGREPGEHPKAWGNCVLMVILARIMDAFCPRNLPAEDPAFGDQPDDLATRVGFHVHHLA